MIGVIKNYNSDKGFGFIAGKDGDVFFHISNFIDKSIVPVVGIAVEYLEGKNEKGTYAYEIKIRDDGKPNFIKLGDKRIKLSNIKDYGIANGSQSYLDEIEIEIIKLSGSIKQITTADEMRRRAYKSLGLSHDCKEELSYKKNQLNEKIKEKKSQRYKLAEKGQLEYLYVTTYQNDNYVFYQMDYDWDIHEKLELLDKYLCI